MAQNPPAIVGDLSSVPESGRSPGEGNGLPLQSSCLRNPMDRGAWRAAVHGVAKSQTRQLKRQTEYRHPDRDLLRETHSC